MQNVVFIICFEVKKVLETRVTSLIIDRRLLFMIPTWLAFRTVTTPAVLANKPTEAMATMKKVQLVERYAIAATTMSAPPNILFNVSNYVLSLKNIAFQKLMI